MIFFYLIYYYYVFSLKLTRSLCAGFPVFPLRTIACKTAVLSCRRRSTNVLRASTGNAARPSCRFDLPLSRTTHIPCPIGTDRYLWSWPRPTSRPPRTFRRLYTKRRYVNFKRSPFAVVNSIEQSMITYFGPGRWNNVCCDRCPGLALEVWKSACSAERSTVPRLASEVDDWWNMAARHWHLWRVWSLFDCPCLKT